MHEIPPANSQIEVRQNDGRIQYDFPRAGLKWFFIGLLLIGILGLAACLHQWGALLGIWPGEVLHLGPKFRIVLTGIFMMLIGICLIAIFGRQSVIMDSVCITWRLRLFGIPLPTSSVQWESVAEIEVANNSDGDPIIRVLGMDGDSKMAFDCCRTIDERNWFRDILEAHRTGASVRPQ